MGDQILVTDNIIDISKNTNKNTMIGVTPLEINYKKLIKEAKFPFKKHDDDAGFDLTAIWKEENDKYIEYGTGLAFDIPKGYVGFLFSRSSITNKDILLKNSVGVVDCGYVGEIMFRFYHLEGNDIYKVGDRIGQIIFMKLPEIELVEAQELNNTERGTSGYGSSGK